MGYASVSYNCSLLTDCKIYDTTSHDYLCLPCSSLCNICLSPYHIWPNNDMKFIENSYIQLHFRNIKSSNSIYGLQAIYQSLQSLCHHFSCYIYSFMIYPTLMFGLRMVCNHLCNNYCDGMVIITKHKDCHIIHQCAVVSGHTFIYLLFI